MKKLSSGSLLFAELKDAAKNIGDIDLEYVGELTRRVDEMVKVRIKSDDDALDFFKEADSALSNLIANIEEHRSLIYADLVKIKNASKSIAEYKDTE